MTGVGEDVGEGPGGRALVAAPETSVRNSNKRRRDRRKGGGFIV